MVSNCAQSPASLGLCVRDFLSDSVYACGSVCEYVHVSASASQGPEMLVLHGTKVTGSCELLHEGSESQTQVLSKRDLNHWTIFPGLHLLCFKTFLDYSYQLVKRIG